MYRTRLHYRHLHSPTESRQNLDVVATASRRSHDRETRDILHDGPGRSYSSRHRNAGKTLLGNGAFQGVCGEIAGVTEMSSDGRCED